MSTVAASGLFFDGTQEYTRGDDKGMYAMNRPPIKRRPLAAAVRIAPITAAIVSGGASAATILVTDNGGFATPDSCTIVDAVASINAAGLRAGCTLSGHAPFGQNDTIDLSSFVSPTTISFANVAGDSALTLTRAATIHGNLDENGQPLVTLARYSLAAPFRLIRAQLPLTVDGLAFTGGSAANAIGGAIFTNAIAGITLTHAVVTGNDAFQGGGIASYGPVNLTSSTVSGNYATLSGGGILGTSVHGTDTVTNSTVSGNYAAYGAGGGIYSRANVVATGSIISGNFAAVVGGGIGAGATVSLTGSSITGNTTQSGGAGIYARSVNVSTSTISDNDAGGTGGGIVAVQDLELYRSTVSSNASHQNGGGVAAFFVYSSNSTISGNNAFISGGGVYAVSTFNAVSTTISGNRLIGANVQRGAGAFVPNAIATLSGTLLYGNNGGRDIDAFAGNISGDHNLIGTWGDSVAVPDDTLQCDPHLSPLASNGGPTQTQAIPFTSCAMDAGPATSTSDTDQRGEGFARVVGPASDIGAFEVQNNDTVFKNGFEGSD